MNVARDRCVCPQLNCCAVRLGPDALYSDLELQCLRGDFLKQICDDKSDMNDLSFFYCIIKTVTVVVSMFWE